MPWITHGISNGQLTTRWPRRDDAYFDAFPAAVRVQPHGPRDNDSDAIAACPTGAIRPGADGEIALDQGRCILCRRCTDIAPARFVLEGPSSTSALVRTALISGDDGSAEEIDAVRRRLSNRTRALRRSVHIRHVDVGSDGSDEWEIQALLNPVYDIHRLGVFFTASPRHADILLVTGIGTAPMVEPLRRVRDGMPDPVVVIGCGTDAISGGIIGGGYTGGTGAGALVPFDVWIPGSPPPPFAILHGILTGVDRLAHNGRSLRR